MICRICGEHGSPADEKRCAEQTGRCPVCVGVLIHADGCSNLSLKLGPDRVKSEWRAPVSADHILASFATTRNVWKTAEILELPARVVYVELRKRDLVKLMPKLEREPVGPSRPSGISRALAGELMRLLKMKRCSIAEFCAGLTGQVPAGEKLSEKRLVNAFREHFPYEWEFLAETRLPRAKRYERGKKVEDIVRADLIAHGYAHVHRSHRSWGPVDLYAFKPGRVLFVQVKAGMNISPEEWNGLLDLARNAGVVPVVAGYLDGELAYVRILAQRVKGYPVVFNENAIGLERDAL